MTSSDSSPDQRPPLSRRDFMRRSVASLAVVSAAGLVVGCGSKEDKPAKTGVPAAHEGTGPPKAAPVIGPPKEGPASVFGETAMPTRTLGKTGLEVSLLSFGGGSQFLKNKNGRWEPLLERAIELGINFFDTSSSYVFSATSSGEERFGEILPRHRDKIFISTKFDSRDPVKARKEFDRSLKRMKTDHVDVIMIHSIEPSEDLGLIETKIYPELLKMREEGLARFIGFSSMNSAPRSKELIERLDLDVTILAMNPTKYGKFATVALPPAKEKNMGVLAMKVMRGLVGKEGTTAKELMRYALTQEGVATALIGHFGMEVLEENVRLVKEFARDAKKADEVGRLGGFGDGADGTEVALSSAPFRRDLEKRLAHHGNGRTLCWARPDYFDGMMC